VGDAVYGLHVGGVSHGHFFVPTDLKDLVESLVDEHLFYNLATVLLDNKPAEDTEKRLDLFISSPFFISH
jgi:hypothetical protein